MSSANRRLVIFLPPMITFPSCSSRASEMIRSRKIDNRELINQCQIITFLISKSDIIENSRIELRGIVLPVPSNQIKVNS